MPKSAPKFIFLQNKKAPSAGAGEKELSKALKPTSRSLEESGVGTQADQSLACRVWRRRLRRA